VFEFVGLPHSELSDFGAKNTRSYPEIDPEVCTLLPTYVAICNIYTSYYQVKLRLAEFYRPYNERLFELVGRTLTL
jgi:hypothetical protein